MQMKRFWMPSFVALVISAAPTGFAQEIRGRLTGTVTDTGGGVLPGVTITASSPALIQPKTTVTGTDGVYRLIALPPGVYDVTFAIDGFQTVKRSGLRVVSNQTFTVNVQLEIATLQEMLVVSGESPVVDTSTTAVGTNFTKELLTEIPNARDIWAAMAQAPGLQMGGFDVGGSHVGTQTPFSAYGVAEQIQTRIEGIDVTEGVNNNGGYLDFGSFEEFQIGTAGNLADQKAPGVSLNVVVKSGGDEFSGSWYSDWEGQATVSDNVPAAFTEAGVRDEDGFFRTRPLTRGNPIARQYDLNGDVGGPIKRGKAWFYYSYRVNKQEKVVLGIDELAETKMPQHTIKGTYQLNSNNQLIGFYNNREKLQPLRGLSPTVPVSAAVWQQSRFVPFKGEWTSVLSDRLFLDVLVGYRWNPVLFAPTTSAQSGAFPLEEWQVGRTELTTNELLDGGAADRYRKWNNRKPQLHTWLAYLRDGWAGTHDFKIGLEIQRDQNHTQDFHPFNLHYRDRNGTPVEVDITNYPENARNRVNRRSGYVNDNWKVNDRLTVNLGVRIDAYRDSWPDEEQEPSPVAVLANDPRFTDFFAPKAVGANTVTRHTLLGPRAGAAYDVGGDGKSVIKAFWGRFYFNSDGIVANQENPVGVARLRYVFNDANGNRVIDDPSEVGRLLSSSGGGGFVRVDPDLKRPYGEEISTHFEREIRKGLSGRASYVYKNMRDQWQEVDLARVNAYTVPVAVTDPGRDGVAGTGDEERLAQRDLAAATPGNRVFADPEDFDSDYHTIEVALNRRFSNRWMLLTSFAHTWLTDFYGAVSSTSAANSAGNTKAFAWQPNQRLFGREQTTSWNYKLVGRYVLPLEVGVSGSYKVQSGGQWGRSLNVRLPNAGTETIRIEPVDANRAPSVAILDLRLDKSFSLPKGRLTGMVDVFNLMNSGTVTTFRTLTAANLLEVTGLLDPRIVRFGIRYEF